MPQDFYESTEELLRLTTVVNFHWYVLFEYFSDFYASDYALRAWANNHNAELATAGQDAPFVPPAEPISSLVRLLLWTAMTSLQKSLGNNTAGAPPRVLVIKRYLPTPTRVGASLRTTTPVQTIVPLQLWLTAVTHRNGQAAGPAPDLGPEVAPEASELETRLKAEPSSNPEIFVGPNLEAHRTQGPGPGTHMESAFPKTTRTGGAGRHLD
ncbi:hypothetical protein MRX96_021001 [Rhipicephalus microplus]